MKIRSWVVLYLFFASCNNEEEKSVGGPCTYETKIYTATVITIEKKDSVNADILFRINDEAGNLYRDSVSWYMENKNWVTISAINKDAIAAGKKYKYQVEKIKTGACTPGIETLTLEKYQ